MSLAGIGPVTVTLGSIEKQTSNFDHPNGLGSYGIYKGGKEDVFASLVAAGKCENVWAMCMYEGSKSNGTITIGGVDERLSVNGTVQYVADVGLGFHSVQVESLALDGKEDIQVGEAAILDTGTNVLLAPTKVMNALQNQMCSDQSLTGCKALWQNECRTFRKGIGRISRFGNET